MSVKEKNAKTVHTYQFNGRVHTLGQMLTVKTRCGSYSRFELIDPEKSGEEGVLADLHHPTTSLHSIESTQLKFERRRKEEGHRYVSVTPHVVHSSAPTPLGTK